MTLTTYPDLLQASPEWFDARRGIVTASTVGNLITSRKLTAVEFDCPSCDAAAGDPCQSKTKVGAVIKTMHPERTAVARERAEVVLETADNDTSRDLTALLVAERINGWCDETYTSFDMMRGIEDEPRAREVYSKHHARVEEMGFMVREEWGIKIGASPDGLVNADGAIEIKSRRPKKQIDTVLAGEPPAENMPQLQTVLLVSGREWLDYVSYASGMALYVTRVYPDPKWYAAIIAAVQNFERTAADMIARYEAATAGMPLTERILDMEISF